MMRTRMTTLPFLLLPLSPFVIFDSDYALISCPLCNSNTLWNISMVLDRTGRDYVLCTRMTTLPFLLLALSHFAIFDSDYALRSVIEYPSEHFDDTW